MSSLVVRQLFEAWLQDAAMAVPYYPTVNMVQDPTDDIWCTAEFGSTYRDTLTFCDGAKIEDGEVELVYFGPPGEGDSAILTAMEADLAVLMQQTDPSGRLVLLNRSAPFEYSGGTADQQYAVSCFVEYQYFY